MLKTCSVHAMVRNSMFAARYWPGHILGMTVVSKYSTECSVVTLTFFQNRKQHGQDQGQQAWSHWVRSGLGRILPVSHILLRRGAWLYEAQ